MSLKLSVVVPTIRLENWPRLYNSIEKSCTKYDFELLLIGPKYSNSLEEKKNVRFVQDYGSPNRAQQIGLILSTGDFVTMFADDCQFKPGMIDKCLDKLCESENHNNVVVTKYTEGAEELQNDDYYRLNLAYPYSPNIKDEWVIFNSAFYWTDYLTSLGGFDTRLNVTCLAHADVGVRSQRAGVKVDFIKESICHCDHGHGDHQIIEITQVYEDAPLYKHIHDTEPNRCLINIHNWKTSPQVWRRHV